MKAAFVVLCGCRQMIAILRTSISIITETQSKVFHSKACKESTDPATTRLRVTAKKTEENRVSFNEDQ